MHVFDDLLNIIVQERVLNHLRDFAWL